MQQSRTVHAVPESPQPESRHLPLVDLLIDARAELTELVVRSGLKVLEAMLEEDRTAVCGPRYAHRDARDAGRAGTTTTRSSWAGARSRFDARGSVLGGERCPCPRSRRWPRPIR